MLHSNCQVCGNPMYSQTYCGTDANGTLNPDYCSNCYKSGQFYARDWNGSLSGPAMPWAMFAVGRTTGPGRGFGI